MEHGNGAFMRSMLYIYKHINRYEVLVDKHNEILTDLAAGLVCTFICLVGLSLNAGEVSQYSFELPSATSVPATTDTQSRPRLYGGVKESEARMEHKLDGVMLLTTLPLLDVLQQDMQIIRRGLEDHRHNIGTLQHHQPELFVNVGRHQADLEVGKPAIVLAKNEDEGTPSPSRVNRRLPNATPQLPNAVPRLPNATPQLPNAVPRLPNATPQLPNAVPQLPNASPSVSGNNR
jgi:hypothetical protein